MTFGIRKRFGTGNDRFNIALSKWSSQHCKIQRSNIFIKPVDHPGHGDSKEDLQGAADDPGQDEKKGRDGHDDPDPPEIRPVFSGIPLVKRQGRKEYAEDQTCGGQEGEDDVKVSL